MEKWIRARHQPSLPLDGNRRTTASRPHIALSRQAAQEGMVLLKNRGNLLPLASGCRVPCSERPCISSIAIAGTKWYGGTWKKTCPGRTPRNNTRSCIWI